MDCEDIDDKSRDCNNRNSHGSRDRCWFVKKHLDKVNWYGLSQNTSILLEFFKEHLDTRNSAGLHSKECKLDWYGLSGNTSIPLEFFEKHLDKVDWNGLSRNTSIVDKPLNIKGAKR